MNSTDTRTLSSPPWTFIPLSSLTISSLSPTADTSPYPNFFKFFCHPNGIRIGHHTKTKRNLYAPLRFIPRASLNRPQELMNAKKNPSSHIQLTSILWLRHNFATLQNNTAFLHALEYEQKAQDNRDQNLQSSCHFIPVCIMNAPQFLKSYGSVSCVQPVLENINHCQFSLQARGSNLLFWEKDILELARSVQAQTIYIDAGLDEFSHEFRDDLKEMSRKLPGVQLLVVGGFDHDSFLRRRHKCLKNWIKFQSLAIQELKDDLKSYRSSNSTQGHNSYYRPHFLSHSNLDHHFHTWLKFPGYLFSPAQLTSDHLRSRLESLKDPLQTSLQVRYRSEAQRVSEYARHRPYIPSHSIVADFIAYQEQYPQKQVDFVHSFSTVFKMEGIFPQQLQYDIVILERSRGNLRYDSFSPLSKRLYQWTLRKIWHQLLASRDQELNRPWNYWSWNGCLCRYIKVPCKGNVDNPPNILFIHGFGASINHWRKNTRYLSSIATCWALDLIGFGRSEKPVTQYTQTLWEMQIYDFVKNVIGESVYVVGNSIGGYLAMCFASDAQNKCKGAVLVNTAGRLLEPQEYKSMLRTGNNAKQQEEQSRSTLKRFAQKNRTFRLLFGYFAIGFLQPRIVSTLKKLYPRNPASVSKRLITEIYRNSTDPGAAEVIGSGLILPSPRPMNELLESFQKPLLILQGQYDPLNDAKDRALKLKKIYPNATLEFLEGGHCVHDELDDVFNKLLSRWISGLEKK